MLRSRARTTPRLAMALLAGLTIAGATVVQGHASVTTPTATGQFAGGRVTGADGHLATGSTAISAADGNFTTGDVGFGILAQGIPAGATITGVTSSTQATISVAATKKTSTAVFAIQGATAALYGWGDATEPDGSILVGDYWNNRVVHYNDDGSEATPFVFTKSNVGFGTDTNQAPFGICVDNSGGPFQGYVYMTEGSLYNVVQYDPNGNWVTSWGTTNAAHSVAFDYPSQCAVNPANGLVYISNQFGKSMVVLNPSTNAATFVSPPSPNTFIQPRGLAFDSLGNIWIADQGHHRVDVYSPSCLQNPWPSGSTCSKPIKEVTPPGGVTTTFDMRGLAIDNTAPATVLTPTPAPLMFVTNGQNCLVQEFNADPTSNYKNVAFLTNFNQANLAGGSDCGLPECSGRTVSSRTAHAGWRSTGTTTSGRVISPTSARRSSTRMATGSTMSPGTGRATTVRRARHRFRPGVASTDPEVRRSTVPATCTSPTCTTSALRSSRPRRTAGH